MNKLFLLLLLVTFFHRTAYSNQPKLVLVLIYDQLRADYLTQLKNEFLPPRSKGKYGGFRFLMEEGAYYPFAQFDILQSMTCPGHAMILTGSYPYNNGIPLNEWKNRSNGQTEYCVDDPIDGFSPRRLKGTTLGDELRLAQPNSKVISISLKDRSAIMLGGHTAQFAFWLSDENHWTTSSFYTKKNPLPSWLLEFNKKQKSGNIASEFGGQITTDFSLKVIKEFSLGQGVHTDLLAVSFSAHDMMGHHFGPHSVEMKNMTIAEDRQLALLFNEIEKLIPGGMKNINIVVTADHGVAPVANYAQSLGVDAGTLDEKKLMDQLNEKLKPIKNIQWIIASRSFNFYFSEKVLLESSENLQKAQRIIIDFLKSQAGVHHVAFANFLPPGIHERQFKKSFFPPVSGDFILIPKPFWYEYSKKNIATHMTGYSYDSTVPIIFWGSQWKRGRYTSEAYVVDIAPTLAFTLGLIPPALNEGKVLKELFSVK